MVHSEPLPENNNI